MYSLSNQVRRLILVTASLVVLPLVVVGYDIGTSKLDRMRDDGLRRDAAELRQLVGLSNERKKAGKPVSEERAVVTPAVETLAFQAWDATNRLAVASPNFAQLPLDAAAAGFSDVSIDDHRWRVLTMLDDNRRWLRVGERYGARNAMKRILLAQLLGFGLIGLPLCAWIGAFAVRRALEPLRMLTERIGERRPEHLAAIGSDGLPRELDPFLASLNALLGRFRTADLQTATPASERPLFP